MDFRLTFTKGEVTDDAAPSSSTPQARIFSLPAYWDGGGKAPTGSVSAYFEVLNSSGAVTADGSVTAQLWLRPLGTKDFVAVGAAQTGLVASTAGRQLVEFKCSGINAPCEAFIQLKTIAGTDKTTVKGYAAATGLRA